MTTTNLGMDLPMISADADTWGNKINAAMLLIDAFCPKVAFGAYLNSASQTLTNSTWTKITLNAEEYDVGSYFDSTTNYRFTPLVAGYYQINGRVEMDSLPAAGGVTLAIYKNGSIHKRGNRLTNSSGANPLDPVVHSIVYLNGSTDYVEFYINQVSGGSLNIDGGDVTSTYFNGALVIPA